MTVEDYYAWGELQEDRYEFVDGCPVPMMSGASRRHDQIAMNVIGELRSRASTVSSAAHLRPTRP